MDRPAGMFQRMFMKARHVPFRWQFHSLVAVLGIGVCLFPAGCHRRENGQKAADTVRFVKQEGVAECQVEEIQWPSTVRTQGNLVADEHAVIGAKVGGRVAEVFVDLGAKVEVGDVLARLELNDFELAIHQSEAQLVEACAAVGVSVPEDAESLDPETVPFVVMERALWEEGVETLERVRRLRENNAIAQSEFDKQLAITRVAKARYDTALRSVAEKIALIQSRRVMVGQARQNRDDATLRAPFRGVVQQRHLSVGNFIQSGSPVVTLVRIDPLRFRGFVPERKATQVRVGQSILITLEGEETPRETTILRASPSLDTASRSLQIEAELPNPEAQLRSGLFAEGVIRIDSQETALAVPITAISEFAGVHKLWIVNDQQLEPRRVVIGRTEGTKMEILSGVDVSDRVLVHYRDGEKSIQRSPDANLASSQGNPGVRPSGNVR